MIRTLMIAALLSTHALAQSPKQEKAEDKSRTVAGGASKGVKACHADIERFCKDVKAGEGRLGACLKSNLKKLSKSCKRWASHGGPSHMEDALARDIDGAPAAPAADAAAPK